MQDQGKVVHSSIPAPLVFSVCLLDFLQNMRTIWTIIWMHVYGYMYTVTYDRPHRARSCYMIVSTAEHIIKYPSR